MNTRNAITLFPLVMLITGAIDSIRNLPATAEFGPALIFFCIAAALLFLLPTGLVSAELSARWTERGGIYFWTQKAFGKKFGVLAIWLQWINTMVWYPTILSFIAGTISYLINPHLASQKWFVISVALAIFWLLTFINLFGIKASTQFVKFCTIIGMIIPMALIILMGLFWVLSAHPLQITFSTKTIFPSFHHMSAWTSLTAIIAAYLGMELATVHVGHVKDAHKTFPRALMISITFIVITMTLGALAIALVLPAHQINLVDGTIQAFSAFLYAYHLAWLLPILVVMILVGSIGGMVNWVISPARGLMQAARDGYLPPIFAKVNIAGVCAPVLLLQAIMVTLICFAANLMPSVNGFYWLLTDLSTQLYLLMYVMLFIAGIWLTLKEPNPNHHIAFKLPGKTWGMWVVGLAGLIGCVISLAVGFIPPPKQIQVGSTLHYELTFGLGLVIMCLPVLGLLHYKKRNSLKKN